MENALNKLEVVKIRLVKETGMYSDKKIRTSKDAISLIAEEFSRYDREVFCVLNLKSDGTPINMNVVSQGTLNESLVSPREVFKSSILSNAAAIIAAHNHPSGNPMPSKDDYKTTQRLEECGRILEIPLYDHIIVGDERRGCYSFKEHDEMGKLNHRNVKERDEWER
ncbi:MAG: JAB domain-containing protein [Anaerovoracaceae bacterium]